MRDWLYSYSSDAGRGAQEKFKVASRRWRKRAQRGLRLVFAGLALALFVAAWLDHAISVGLVFGVALGALYGSYLVFRDSPPPYIEYWRAGAEGERKTAAALAPLRRRGYTVLHDLPDRHGNGNSKANIDHIVISTAGVFLLDTKNLGGEVSVVGDTIHVQRLDDDDASYTCQLGRAMRGQAVRLQEDIQGAGVEFVQAVAVFWNPLQADDRPIIGDRVVYLHGEHLAGWLQAQPVKLTAARVASVVAAIEQARPPDGRPRARLLGRFGSRRAQGLAHRGRAAT